MADRQRSRASRVRKPSDRQRASDLQAAQKRVSLDARAKKRQATATRKAVVASDQPAAQQAVPATPAASAASSAAHTPAASSAAHTPAASTAAHTPAASSAAHTPAAANSSAPAIRQQAPKKTGGASRSFRFLGFDKLSDDNITKICGFLAGDRTDRNGHLAAVCTSVNQLYQEHVQAMARSALAPLAAKSAFALRCVRNPRALLLASKKSAVPRDGSKGGFHQPLCTHCSKATRGFHLLACVIVCRRCVETVNPDIYELVDAEAAKQRCNAGSVVLRTLPSMLIRHHTIVREREGDLTGVYHVVGPRRTVYLCSDVRRGMEMKLANTQPKIDGAVTVDMQTMNGAERLVASMAAKRQGGGGKKVWGEAFVGRAYLPSQAVLSLTEPLAPQSSAVCDRVKNESGEEVSKIVYSRLRPVAENLWRAVVDVGIHRDVWYTHEQEPSTVYKARSKHFSRKKT